MVFMCENVGVVNGFILPLIAGASTVTVLFIAFGYMLGQALHNPKVSLWAKTEVIQLFMSAVYAVLIFAALQAFCTFNFASVGDLFGLDTGAQGALNIFDAADGYLREGAFYIKDVLSVARYHLGAYSIFQMRSLWLCEEGGVTNILFCIFGSAVANPSGGASAGIGVSPESGYALAAAGMNVAFNSLLFSYLSTLNYLFILNYILSAMIFFFLPLGIFLRSMPYLRGLGSLFMAMTLAFLFVYPSVLSIFYLDLIGPRVLNPEPSDAFQGYINAEGRLEDVGADDLFDTCIYDDLFGENCGNVGGSVEMEVMQLSGNAFLIGVFIPTLALLAAMGSLAYINRFLGQEIDLSRIVQMV